MADQSGTLAIVGTLVSVAGAALYMLYGSRQQASVVEAVEPRTVESAPARPPTSSTDNGEKKKKKKAKSAGPSAGNGSLSSRTRGQEREDNGHDRDLRPEIKKGTRCWHCKLEEECTVVKVYYDDPPPYYVVRMGDGSERSTVRSRLDTFEERNALLKAAEMREAELQAETIAAELLADEAKSKKGTGKGAKKRAAKAS